MAEYREGMSPPADTRIGTPIIAPRPDGTMGLVGTNDEGELATADRDLASILEEILLELRETKQLQQLILEAIL